MENKDVREAYAKGEAVQAPVQGHTPETKGDNVELAIKRVYQCAKDYEKGMTVPQKRKFRVQIVERLQQ
jgi:hypothetical protein